MTRWFSDASALTRYGIPTVNYGTSTGLMDVEKGENLEIDGLVKTAEVYAGIAMRVCRRRRERIAIVLNQHKVLQRPRGRRAREAGDVR